MPTSQMETEAPGEEQPGSRARPAPASLPAVGSPAHPAPGLTRALRREAGPLRPAPGRQRQTRSEDSCLAHSWKPLASPGVSGHQSWAGGRARRTPQTEWACLGAPPDSSSQLLQAQRPLPMPFSCTSKSSTSAPGAGAGSGEPGSSLTPPGRQVGGGGQTGWSLFLPRPPSLPPAHFCLQVNKRCECILRTEGYPFSPLL